MESPFRSEAAAFRFVLVCIGAAALVVAGSWLHPAIGLVVFLALVVGGAWIYMRQRGPAPPPWSLDASEAGDERRVLVVANETVGGGELMDTPGEIAPA